ncbi:MAG: Integral membrane protein, partial [uncultured Thermoleophilia bacterium]
AQAAAGGCPRGAPRRFPLPALQGRPRRHRRGPAARPRRRCGRRGAGALPAPARRGGYAAAGAAARRPGVGVERVLRLGALPADGSDAAVGVVARPLVVPVDPPGDGDPHHGCARAAHRLAARPAAHAVVDGLRRHRPGLRAVRVRDRVGAGRLGQPARRDAVAARRLGGRRGARRGDDQPQPLAVPRARPPGHHRPRGRRDGQPLVARRHRRRGDARCRRGAGPSRRGPVAGERRVPSPRGRPHL